MTIKNNKKAVGTVSFPTASLGLHIFASNLCIIYINEKLD